MLGFVIIDLTRSCVKTASNAVDLIRASIWFCRSDLVGGADEGIVGGYDCTDTGGQANGIQDVVGVTSQQNCPREMIAASGLTSVQ